MDVERLGPGRQRRRRRGRAPYRSDGGRDRLGGSAGSFDVESSASGSIPVSWGSWVSSNARSRRARKSATRGVGLLGGEVPALDELLGVALPDRRVRVDERVHARLRERGLVGLVVPVAAVADQVDDDVLVERLTERERQVA